MCYTRLVSRRFVSTKIHRENLIMHTYIQNVLEDKSFRILLVLYILFTALFPIFIPTKVDAANFQQVYVRLDRLKASTSTGGMVCAQPATTGTEHTVQVTFPG